MSKRKTKPGRLVRSIETLARGLAQGDWFYVGDKPLHPSWLQSMPFHALLIQLRYPRIRRCIWIGKPSELPRSGGPSRSDPPPWERR